VSDNDQTPQEQPDYQQVSMDRLLEVLRCGEINSEYGIMRWSSNYTFLVSVVFQDIKLMAVYKPQKGERPLWDFPDGTLCYRELAAFLTSRELTWDVVPPTVLRDGPRGLGSLQFYIEHDPEVNYFSFDETMKPQLQRLAAFDYIVNNADRKGGHCLVDPSGRLWGIDHGITFHSAPKLRTVVWDFAGQPIPDELMPNLEGLCVNMEDPDSDFRHQMGELLSSNELKTCHARLKHLLKSRRYPLPGSGPNYPWPPV
jgi:uncharacterized repeat protein (TIGR03843 family)